MTGSSTADGVEFGLVVVLRFSFSFKLFVTLFWEAPTHNDAHATPSAYPYVLQRDARCGNPLA